MPDDMPPTQAKKSPWDMSDRAAATGPAGKSRFHEKQGLILAALVLIGIIVGGYFFTRKPQGPNVGLQFPNLGQVLLGDQFAFSISSSNYSDSILKNAKISLQLPDGVSFLGQSTGQRIMEQDIGDLGPGSIDQKSFELIVTNGANSLKHLSAKLSYDTGSGSSVYQTSAETDILVGQPAISLNISAPQSILNGQDFQIQVSYANNTSHDFKNLHLKLAYPPFFQFKTSSMQNEAGGNNSWNLGTLSATSNGTITITGSVVGEEKTVFGLNGALTATFLGEDYTVNTQSVNVAIAQAPLSLAISVNTGPDYVASLDDTLNYTLTYTNNSQVVMQNVTVNAVLTGDLFDFANLSSDVPLNSPNKITWYAGNAPQLMNVAPGQSGSVTFRIKLKNAFPIRLLSDKNFTVKVDGEVDSPTVPQNTTAAKTISVASLTNKIAGNVDLAALAYWRDAASGILNGGPYPPRVNQPTKYTIHWRIVNYATDLSGVTVSGYLQNGVKFTGVVKSNMNTSPAYDANSGLVTWQIPSIPATKGVIGAPAEAIFQVEATPSVNLAGRNMPLVSDIALKATDSFVNAPLQAAATAIDTSLPNDSTLASFNSRGVQQ